VNSAALPPALAVPAAVPESLETALTVAEIVAVIVANSSAHERLAEEAVNLGHATESRSGIERAKGILMAQRHVNADQAFEILREASQRYNRKLRDIAAGIVDAVQPDETGSAPAARRCSP
jgi:AmiR/NasT family two-component response regulator